MSYPIVKAYDHASGKRVSIEPMAGPILHMPEREARLLATRLVAVVGCEQVDAARKRNEELRGLLREQVNIGRMCHICGAHPCYSGCRLRAALEGR